MTVELTQERAKRLRELMELPDYREAIAAGLGRERETLVETLRNCARVGDTLGAARADAKILALEEVLPILERAAAEYRVTRE